ncbi:MAG: ECF transporter S component [Clostridia bacterium]
MHNNKIRWITRTAIFLALLVLLQFVTKPLGQLVTGSVVNLLLAASAVLCGTAAGVVIALVSPFLAYFLGIGPAFIQLLPFIALGNLTLVLTFSLLLKRSQTVAYWFMAIVSAALLKFIVLYLGVVQLALPLIPNIKSTQLTMLTAMFSWPQLITAAIGGLLAFLLVPPVQKALQHK